MACMKLMLFLKSFPFFHSLIVSMAKPTNDDEKFEGRVIFNGKYELGRLLGHGSFGKVFHAKNRKTGQICAMKVVNKDKVKKHGTKEQLKREISVMRKVRHPNIVDLYEVMASKTRVYFAMELVKGGELFHIVSKGRIEEGLARKYFYQLISAVEFCHSRGVYHRDLKPENLLLDGEGNLKVTDFGLSALSDQTREDGLLHTACGTPTYVAPEVIGKRGYDGAKADIWSSGVILFVLLAGYLPFMDNNLVGIYRRIHQGEYHCPSWFSPEAKKTIRKMLDLNPKTRISTAKLMKTSWYRKEYKKWTAKLQEHEIEEDFEKEPPKLNAFHLISSFNLSGLFQLKRSFLRVY